ncbi:MAG: GNAT family N-acetyltransferase [Gammaproteobacteria bacterium]
MTEMGEDLEIRLLTQNDLQSAMRLKELARWNQTERDWRRLLALEPEGCFAGCLNGRIVGTLTTTTYGKELAWIGMVIVDPDYRRRGIATQLMHAGLDYLSRAGIATIKLDATPAGRPAYELLGFVEEALIERWQADAPQAASGDGVSEDLGRDEMLALDRKAFGADRSRLLDALVTDACPLPLALRAPDHRSRGYALAREGTAASYIGPLVATDGPTAVSLVDGMLKRMTRGKTYVDFYTGFATGTSVLAERGFVKQRDLIRMRYGQNSNAGTSEMVFAIAGPEIG